MDKERAKSYVLFSMFKSNMNRKYCTALLSINLLFFAISLILYHKTIFLSIVLMFALLNIIAVAITSHKWSVRLEFVSRGIMWIFLIIAFDCLDFAMYKRANMFVWYEYLINVSVQIVCFISSLLICRLAAKKHDKESKCTLNNTAVLAPSLAGLSYSGIIVFCKIFLTDASLSLVLTIFSVIIFVMTYLLAYVAVSSFYCSYLIHRYNLELDELNRN